MKEFKTLEEMRNDEELQSMCRSEWRKVKLSGKEVYACKTDQQYEDIVCGGIYDMLYNLFKHFDISTEDMFISDFIPFSAVSIKVKNQVPMPNGYRQRTPSPTQRWKRSHEHSIPYISMLMNGQNSPLIAA